MLGEQQLYVCGFRFDMEQFLALGFVVGMGHALEADHLAAVGALSSERSSHKRLALLGASWGLGHTITLFLLCSAVIFPSKRMNPTSTDHQGTRLLQTPVLLT